MKHRTQLEIDGLQRAEGVLDAAETFVGAHCRGGVGLRGWQIGADHIDAVERGVAARRMHHVDVSLTVTALE